MVTVMGMEMATVLVRDLARAKVTAQGLDSHSASSSLAVDSDSVTAADSDLATGLVTGLVSLPVIRG